MVKATAETTMDEYTVFVMEKPYMYTVSVWSCLYVYVFSIDDG